MDPTQEVPNPNTGDGSNGAAGGPPAGNVPDPISNLFPANSNAAAPLVTPLTGGEWELLASGQESASPSTRRERRETRRQLADQLFPTPPPTTQPRRTTWATQNAGQTGTPSRPSRTAPATTGRPAPRSGNATQPLQPNLSDMERPHTWRGQRQPPVGTRLMQILNWVNDEDIDRRRDWARELDEAEDWVREQLDKRDENNLGDDTITLLYQAEAAMKTHRRNEKYHYRTFMDLKVPNPDELPRYAPRLPYNPANPIELSVVGPKGKTAEIMPQFPPIPRPWRSVNNMWQTEREATLDTSSSLAAIRNRRLNRLAAAEERLWALPAGAEPQTLENNLFLVENHQFERVTNQSDGGLRDGWVHHTQVEGDKSDSRDFRQQVTRLVTARGDYAAERGLRRAGLQAALRQFHSTENHMIANNGRMLVLPGGTKADVIPDLDEVERKAGIGDSRPIELTELPANQMQRIDGKTDPQGFNANMAQFWREARELGADAVRSANAREFRASPDGPMHPIAADAWKPLVPNSLFGPFVWRGVSASVQLRQDCLRQMRALKKLFDREMNIAPRQLLLEMEATYQRGFLLDPDPSDVVRLVDNRDMKPGPSVHNDPDAEQKPHYLNTVEMEWVRFLLNHSMTEGMASEALPRTTVFLTFAQRLERIFNDPGDNLFPDITTSVTIEDLIAHMAQMKGPVQKTTFYVYDVKMFLERLAFQGRCRYTEDWRSYGRVQRPLLRYFPEDLIIWAPRGGDSADPNTYPEDAKPEMPRYEDLQTWHDIVHANPPESLDAGVRNFFLCLAYRWGHGTRRLEAQEENWGELQVLPLRRYLPVLNEVSTQFERLLVNGETQERPVVNLLLEEVWRRTLNKPDTELPPDGTTVVREIQRAVLQEVVRADNMLYPGRTTDYHDLFAPRTRESIWDWAKPEVRGHRKKFFSLDRWPVQLQSAKTQQRIKDDVDIDTDMIWNPIIEDPAPWTYYRPKAIPYGDERVKFKTGQRLFPIGDTRRQREVVKNQIIAMVGSAMGIVPDDNTESGGVFSKLKGMLGFGTKRPRAVLDNPDDDGEDGVTHRHKLPRVDPSLIPPSVDVIAEAEASMRAYEDATKLDVIPADQVPEDAQDVRFIERAVPNRDNALVVEQNVPL